jgi:hypothetical protein
MPFTGLIRPVPQRAFKGVIRPLRALQGVCPDIVWKYVSCIVYLRANTNICSEATRLAFVIIVYIYLYSHMACVTRLLA